MIGLIIAVTYLVTVSSAFPSKPELVVITPTYGPPKVEYEDVKIAVPKHVLYHHPSSKYSGIHQIYPPAVAEDKKLFYPSTYGVPIVTTKHHHDSKESKEVILLHKYYDNFSNKKAKVKANFLKKAVDKTVDVTAKLTQYTVDFITKVAIETAAKIAKRKAEHVLVKKEPKVIAVKYYDH